MHTQAIASQQMLPDLRYAVLFATYSHPIVLQNIIFSCGRLHNSQSAMQGELRSSAEVHAFDVMVAAERPRLSAHRITRYNGEEHTMGGTD